MSFDINRVLDELKKVNPNGFINECHFQIEFGYALKRAYPKYEITFEWHKENKRVDLFANDEKEKIGFEFKYYTKEEIRVLNYGLKVMLKEQAAANLTRIGYWIDVEKLECFVQRGVIDFGYCLLLTNDKRVFNVLGDNNMDKDYDVSNGIKPGNRTLHYYSKKGLMEDRTLHIKNEYTLNNESYGNDLYLLVLPITL